MLTTGLIVAALTAQLQHAQPRRTLYGFDVGMITAPRRELKVKTYHMAAAVSGGGEIVGAVLDRAGRVVCEFRGAYAADGSVAIDDGCRGIGR